MRHALTLLLLAAVAAAGPSDFLRYEGTKNGARVALRTHAHAFGADGYRPVSPMWADVPYILALSPHKDGKLQFKIALLDAGELKLRGEAATSGDEATVTYRFSSKGDDLTVEKGTATVTMTIDDTSGARRPRR